MVELNPPNGLGGFTQIKVIFKTRKPTIMTQTLFFVRLLIKRLSRAITEAATLSLVKSAAKHSPKISMHQNALPMNNRRGT